MDSTTHTSTTRGADIPLRPEAAPEWLAPALRGISSGAVHADIGDAARPRTNQYGKEAAVLVLLSGAQAPQQPGSYAPDAQLLLTHRTPTLRSHSGQIAFPGGRLDATDPGPVFAALREAAEETGLRSDDVTPLSQLERVHIRATGYPVHPILAHWPTPKPLRVASPVETDDVFQVPLGELLDPRHRFTIGLRGWTGPAFSIRGYVIWGFTGGLISSLLKAAGWEEPWDTDTVVDLRDALQRSRNNERSMY